jgi:hypothetical protein
MDGGYRAVGGELGESARLVEIGFLAQGEGLEESEEVKDVEIIKIPLGDEFAPHGIEVGVMTEVTPQCQSHSLVRRLDIPPHLVLIGELEPFPLGTELLR